MDGRIGTLLAITAGDGRRRFTGPTDPLMMIDGQENSIAAKNLPVHRGRHRFFLTKTERYNYCHRTDMPPTIAARLVIPITSSGRCGDPHPHGLAFLLMVLAVTGITSGADAPSTLPRPANPESGVASWYGYPYHGRHAANGEIYDMEKLTAAHRTLPFGTLVRVVNLRNQKAVDVRINDRGPFVEGRVIDLSKAAARAIDLLQPGVTPVRVEVIGTPAAVPDGLFAVQVGAFRDFGNAERCVATMKARYGSARHTTRDGDPIFWRVLVGAEKAEERARALATRIRQDSGERTAFVVRLDQ